MGLKLERELIERKIVDGSNRTIVGLKPTPSSLGCTNLTRSNRTIVGLKHCALNFQVLVDCSNRTIVGLKLEVMANEDAH